MKRGNKTPISLDEIKRRVRVDDSTGCWEWIPSKNSTGYGIVGINYKTYLVHRVVYAMSFGEIPDSMMVCHHCDNRACCNPDHLFIGTAKDNSDDMMSKGRGVHQVYHGPEHPNSKLSADEVRTVRDKTKTHKELISMFGISKTTIKNVRAGRSYATVD